MKRILAVLLVGLMLVSSCAVAEGNFNLVPTDTAGELTFYIYNADDNIVHNANAVAAMAEKYPKLKVNIEHRADSDGTALKTWAAVGELPDMMEITNADAHETLLANGDLYRLNDVLDKTGFYDLYKNGDFYANAHCEADGSRYSFGVSNSDILVCYYNVALLNELGLTAPTNFDEFKNCITVLKDAGKIPVALFAAEQWPGMAVYDMACIAEGATKAVDPVNNGSVKMAEDEAYLRAAEKFVEIAEMGAFGTGALSTNASQAFELLASGEAGFVFNGSWHFSTGETEGYGENLGWCRYNIFADADKAEDVKNCAVGGNIPKHDFSVNANSKSGLDAETVASLAFEFYYLSSLSKAQAGLRSMLKGEFAFVGSEHYTAFNTGFANYQFFSDMPFNLSNGQFCADLGNAVEMMVSGNFAAQDFIDEMTACGF